MYYSESAEPYNDYNIATITYIIIMCCMSQMQTLNRLLQLQSNNNIKNVTLWLEYR